VSAGGGVVLVVSGGVVVVPVVVVPVGAISLLVVPVVLVPLVPMLLFCWGVEQAAIVSAARPRLAIFMSDIVRPSVGG
jgi:hypothetical protein